eukprot:COSAG06_NODE_3870_length_4815_cov_5.357294_4_plen_173_part_01
MRVRGNPRSTVIRITNRTNSFLELVKGETRLVAVGTSGGHLSSSTLDWEDEEDEVPACAWLRSFFRCCGGQEVKNFKLQMEEDAKNEADQMEEDVKNKAEKDVTNIQDSTSEQGEGKDADDSDDSEQRRNQLEAQEEAELQRKASILERVPLLQQLQKKSIRTLADKIVSKRF